MQSIENLELGAGLLREPLDSVSLSTTGAAIVEWEDGDHTHLALEVMARDGSWQPLATVALTDCLNPAIRPALRQFPMFRLAWYGQVAEPNVTPQRLVPAQARCVSCTATTAP